jgi:hypothetical protein
MPNNILFFPKKNQPINVKLDDLGEQSEESFFTQQVIAGMLLSALIIFTLIGAYRLVNLVRDTHNGAVTQKQVLAQK